MVVFRCGIHPVHRFYCFFEPIYRRLPLPAIILIYRPFSMTWVFQLVNGVTAGLVLLFLRVGNSRCIYCPCMSCSLRSPSAARSCAQLPTFSEQKICLPIFAPYRYIAIHNLPIYYIISTDAPPYRIPYPASFFLLIVVLFSWLQYRISMEPITGLFRNGQAMNETCIPG